MAPDLDDPPGRTAACPRCPATVRPGAPWCTQCYADLRHPDGQVPHAPAAAVPEPVAEPVAEPAAVVPPQPVGEVGATAWPCGSCSAPNAYARTTCATCGAAFLTGLRDGVPPSLVLPGVGDLLALDRGVRLLLAGGCVVLLVTLVLVLGLLLP